MKRLTALTVVLMFVFCSGCGDSHESLAADGVATMKEMNSLLDGVKDEASATAAKPKLKSLMEKFNDINKRQEKLKAPTEDEIKTMESKYGKEMEEAQKKFQANMFRLVSDPKIAAQLNDIGPGPKMN